jgi:hypothetical protein
MVLSHPSTYQSYLRVTSTILTVSTPILIKKSDRHGVQVHQPPAPAAAAAYHCLSERRLT